MWEVIPDKKEINIFLKTHYGFTLRKRAHETGAFSKVYFLNRNKVLKLSIDPYWYCLMKYLHAKQCEHVPELLVDHGAIGHAIVKGYECLVYAVEMPKYRLPKYESENYKLQQALNGGCKISSESVAKTKDTISQFCALPTNTLRKMVTKHKLNSWITDLDIQLKTDYHRYNLMEDKQNNLIILDPIFCSAFCKVL